MGTQHSCIPCVVFAYNRPDKLKAVLRALESQRVDRLIAYVDGPRSNIDVPLVDECRAIARGVEWTAKELHLKEYNGGLVGLGDDITEVFSQHRAAVFVEDDCLPMPGFYYLMRQALEYYASYERVFSIGGYQPLARDQFTNYPYSFVSYWRFTCWGWGTWQDRWEAIDSLRSSYHQLYDSLRSVPDIAGYDLRQMARSLATGATKTWDVQVALAALWLGKVHLLSTKGLVRNIGHDGSGVHGGRCRPGLHNVNVYEQPVDKIVWLDDVEPRRYYVNRLKAFVRLASGKPEDQRERFQVRRRMSTIQRTIRHQLANLLPGRLPGLYSVVDNPMAVPVQIAGYRLIAGKYITPGKRVLDVGMGLGYGMTIMHEAGAQVAGIDVDPKAVKRASELTQFGEVRCYDGMHIPYPDESFDIVCCIDVVEHVPDYRRFIRELVRVSTQLVVISTPNRRPEYTRPNGRPKNRWHIREWSYEEFHAILEQIPGVSVQWRFLNGPWEGPFTATSVATMDTLALTPVLVRVFPDRDEHAASPQRMP